MRRRLLAFLLVPFILVAFISCEGDIFGTISDFMGQTSSNVYAENGLVQIDTSQGAAVTESTGSILALAEPVTDPSDSEYSEDDVTAYEAAYEEKVETIKDSITEALTSPTKTETLVEALSEPLKEGTTAPTKVTTKVTELETEYDIDIPEPETEGDLVTLILLTELYEDASPLIDAMNDEDDTNDPTEEELLDFVSDAQQVVNIVKTVSPAGAINLDDILESLIDDPEALDQILGRSSDSRSFSRVEEPVDDEDDVMLFAKPIFENVIAAIGTQPGTGDYEGQDVIISSNLRKAIGGFAMMRGSYERMAPALAGSGIELDLPDVINYALSVVFTEADAFFASLDTDTALTFEEVLNDVIAWMDLSEEEQDLEAPAFIEEREGFDWGTAFDDFIDGKPAFGSEGKIRTTLDSLIGAIPSDLTLLEDALDDLFEPEPEV